MSCAPDSFVALGLDDDADTFFVIAFPDGIRKFLAHFRAEAVEVRWILHFYEADAIFDAGIYDHIGFVIRIPVSKRINVKRNCGVSLEISFDLLDALVKRAFEAG